jgi:hypothetical protein
MRAGQSAKLRDLGYDEIRLRNWLAEPQPGWVLAKSGSSPRS